jgi:hypothetical protein
MSRLLTALLFIWSVQVHANPTPEIDLYAGYVNWRVESIRYLDIAGKRYHVSFDHAFGSNLFDGDPVGADAAVTAIRGVLGSRHENVDNGHAIATPLFSVLYDSSTGGAYSACRLSYVPECGNPAEWFWRNVGQLSEPLNPQLLAYFEVATDPVIDVDAVNGTAETIWNLDIGGTLYNVSFDQSFGAQVFEGNDPGAELAADAINAALNAEGHELVDNGSPPDFPIFFVYSEAATKTGYAGCRTGWIDACSTNPFGWVKMPMWDSDSQMGNGLVGAAFFSLAVPVAIDVRPGNATNKVFPNKSGKIPVAILSSAEFDAVQVDPATLQFGSAKASVAEAPTTDSNVDGEFGNDTVAKFKVQESGIFCDDTEVTLSGATYAGDPFISTDNIDASDCVSGGCHPY